MSSEDKLSRYPAPIQEKLRKKEKLTREELSVVRSVNAKVAVANRIKNGNNRGGRPAALPGMTVEVRSLSIRSPDYKEIQKWACDENITIVEEVHKIVELHKQYMSGKILRRVACNADGLPEIVIKVRRRMLRPFKTVDDRNELEALQAELSELILSGLVESKYSDLCKYNPPK